MSNFTGFEDKTTHFEIVKNPDIQAFIKECQYIVKPSGEEAERISSLFHKVSKYDGKLPDNIISIDGSNYEASIDEHLPFTRVGYVKIGNILIKRDAYVNIGKNKFIDPFRVAEMEKTNSSTIFAFPSSNMQYKGEPSVKDGFRLALDDYLYKYRINLEDSQTSLRSTLFKLAGYRAGVSDSTKIYLHVCPNENCNNANIAVLDIKEKQLCPECKIPIYPSDCLRIWEEVEDNGSNQTALTRFTNAVEHLFAVHYIRTIVENNPESYVDTLSNLCIFMDGPLAVFGNAAWIHKSIMKYLHEINCVLTEHNKSPMLIIGLVKNGAVVDYFRLIESNIPCGTVYCLTDEIRNKYVNFNRKASSSTFGSETYYGQDFIYKSQSGKLFVFNLPYPFEGKENVKTFIVEKSSINNYINLDRCIALIEEFESDLYSGSVVPVALAQKHTIINLKPGNQILDLLTRENL